MIDLKEYIHLEKLAGLGPWAREPWSVSPTEEEVYQAVLEVRLGTKSNEVTVTLGS